MTLSATQICIEHMTSNASAKLSTIYPARHSSVLRALWLHSPIITSRFLLHVNMSDIPYALISTYQLQIPFLTTGLHNLRSALLQGVFDTWVVPSGFGEQLDLGVMLKVGFVCYRFAFPSIITLQEHPLDTPWISRGKQQEPDQVLWLLAD